MIDYLMSIFSNENSIVFKYIDIINGEFINIESIKKVIFLVEINKYLNSIVLLIIGSGYYKKSVCKMIEMSAIRNLYLHDQKYFINVLDIIE